MRIVKTVQKIPGGLMVVPLFLGAFMNTFFPNLLKLGSFTTATFSSAAVGTAIGIQLTCIGAQINIRQTPEVLKRGLVLLVAKFLAGFIPALVVGKMFGPAGVLGLTPLVLLGSISNSNGSLYLGLMGEYGDEIDAGAMSILGINDGPFLTLLGMGIGGLANIPLMALVATVVPVILGIVLGNLDVDVQKLLEPGGVMLIPFVGFALGAGLNFKTIVSGGISGLILGLLTVVISGLFCILADRTVLKRPGYAGAAVASSAGNSVATPAAVAMVDPSWQPYVAQATAAAGASVVITAILVPILTTWAAKHFGSAKDLTPKGGSPRIEEQPRQATA